MGCNKSSSKREVYSNTVLPKEIRKNRIHNLTLHLKQLEKEEKKLAIGKKSTNFEMKNERLQQTMQIYKGL